MTILRQIKDLKTEFASIHSHVLRRVIQINGGIPLDLDPKKPLRRTLLPGWLVIGGLPSPPSYEVLEQEKPEAGYYQPEQTLENAL
jgi:hypothetical protein